MPCPTLSPTTAGTTSRPRPAAATAAPVDAASLTRRVADLVAAAADLGPQDADGWRRLARTAREVTGDAAAVGRLPVHLVVAVTDPPAVVARTLVAAVRRLRR
jgi:hypothetical protein